jgi:hypothetical protein
MAILDIINGQIGMVDVLDGTDVKERIEELIP